MSEEHGDVRNVMRALDGVEFGYRTFGSAVARLPQAGTPELRDEIEPEARVEAPAAVPGRDGSAHTAQPQDRADPPAPTQPPVAAIVPVRHAAASPSVKLSEIFQLLSGR